MVKESSIEKSIINYAESKGWIQFKINNGRGEPDRCILSHNHCFFIEFKSKTGRLRESQKLLFTKWCGKQIEIYVIDSVKNGKELIDKQSEKYLSDLGAEKFWLLPELRFSIKVD